MKLKKIISSVLAAVCAVSLSACSGNGTSGSEPSGTPSSSESSPDTEPDYVRVVALKGPTAMGMTKMMKDNEAVGVYDFSIVAAVDEISPMVAQGTADIVCVPANLGSVLYNKTEGGVQALAVNTLGVLYICENGKSVNSVEDLRGKTIYSSGKGATPEYALNFILKSNGIDPEKDVTIEWKSEHAECLQSLLTNENSVAMLPQPFVTTAQTKNESVRVALDLNDEWDKADVSSSLLTGIVIVRREFAERFPHAVGNFLAEYESSVEFVNGNISEAAELIGGYDIVPAAVAEKAIPNCHIVCITGDEMKEKLGGYLRVLFDGEPKSVGGALPKDDFYFGV